MIGDIPTPKPARGDDILAPGSGRSARADAGAADAAESFSKALTGLERRQAEDISRRQVPADAAPAGQEGQEGENAAADNSPAIAAGAIVRDGQRAARTASQPLQQSRRDDGSDDAAGDADKAAVTAVSGQQPAEPLAAALALLGSSANTARQAGMPAENVVASQSAGLAGLQQAIAASGRIPGEAEPADIANAGEDSQLRLPGAEDATSRRYRVQRATGEGGHIDIASGRNGGERAATESAMPAKTGDDTVFVLESRRYLGLAAGSSGAPLTRALTSDPDWQLAMQRSNAMASGETATATPVNTLKLQLNPFDLGAVTALLRLKGDALNVHLTVETRAAFRQLSDDSSSIVDALRQQGYAIDQVVVSIATTARAETADGQPQQPGQHQAAPEHRGEPGAGRRQSAENSQSGLREEEGNASISGSDIAAADARRTGHIYL